MSYSSLFLATSPVAYYLLTETSGTTAGDSSGNGHVASYEGTVTLGQQGLIPGETDTAAALGGAGTVSCPALMLTPPFSLSMIVNPLGDAGVSKGYGTLFGYAANRRILWADANNGANEECLLVQMGVANLFTANGTVKAGTAHHIVYTNDGATETVYVDGAAVGSQANAAASWTGAFYVGTYAALGQSYQLEGTVEKVGVNNVCLSASQVASLAAAVFPPPPPPPSGIAVMQWNGTAYVPASSPVTIWVGPNQPANAANGDIWQRTTS